MTPDVNVLLAAFRPDHTHHAIAAAWLAQARLDCLEGRETLVLLPMVLAGFLRLVTSPQVFAEPDTPGEAVGFLDALLATPGAQLRACAEEWAVLRNKLLLLGLTGNWITDACIAAAVEMQHEHLVTFDRDFVKLLPARDFTLLGRR
jgi:hypothetical protein